MSGSGHARHLFQQVDVFRMICEFVVTNQRTKRLSTGHTELVFVKFLEQSALVELNGFVKILEDLSLGYIQHPQL